MFHHIEVKYSCSKCGSDTESLWITRSHSSTAHETYIKCQSCGHESLYSITTITDCVGHTEWEPLELIKNKGNVKECVTEY